MPIKEKTIIAPCVILVEPQLDQNIGKTARAMLNFGLTDLRLIRPKALHNNKPARALSAGAEEVLENAKVYDTLKEATAELTLVMATTTRPREMIKDVHTPRKAMDLSYEHLDQHADHRVGFLFGPERSGLENDDIAFCDSIITAPLNPEFSSLNLAQAVVLIAYEWFQASRGTDALQGPQAQAVEMVLNKNPQASCVHTGEGTQKPSEPLASQKEIQGFLSHLETELENAGYFRAQHMKETMVGHLRNMFGRMPFTFQEMRTLRGVLSSLANPRGDRSREKSLKASSQEQQQDQKGEAES